MHLIWSLFEFIPFQQSDENGFKLVKGVHKFSLQVNRDVWCAEINATHLLSLISSILCEGKSLEEKAGDLQPDFDNHGT